MPSFLHLYQLCMILNCLLNFLRLNTDVLLRGGCGTVLKEPLHQRYVKAVCVVDVLNYITGNAAGGVT